MMEIVKNYWVVEHMGSPGFYVRLTYQDGTPSFTDIGQASHYSSLEAAEWVIDRIEEKGFTIHLEPQPLEITYRVGV